MRRMSSIHGKLARRCMTFDISLPAALLKAAAYAISPRVCLFDARKPPIVELSSFVFFSFAAGRRPLYPSSPCRTATDVPDCKLSFHCVAARCDQFSRPIQQTGHNLITPPEVTVLKYPVVMLLSSGAGMDVGRTTQLWQVTFAVLRLASDISNPMQKRKLSKQKISVFVHRLPTLCVPFA